MAAAGAEASSSVQINTVRAEAEERLRGRVPAGTPWKTLTPEMLARILDSDAITELAWGPFHSTAALLIDQAGHWDLLHFERPSDVLAAWRRWRPDDPALQPIPASEKDLPHRSFGFYADAPYSDEAGAFMALWGCWPRPAWNIVGQEPGIWALRWGHSWQQPNTFDFGNCVRKQDESGHPASDYLPDSERGRRSAAVLEKKLAALLTGGHCTRGGPDDCLTTFEALVSLSPTHPSLPAIAKALAPDFEPDPQAPIPAAQRSSRSAPWDDPVWHAAQAAREDTMRQVLFVDQWLRILAHWPAGRDAPPMGEPRHSLHRLQALSRDLLKLDSIQGTISPWPTLRYSHSFANPWEAVATAARQHPAWRTALAEIGAQDATQADCEYFTDSPGFMLPASYWAGFAVARLEATADSCQTLKHSGLASAYSKAESELEYFASLRAMIGDEQRVEAHLEIVNEIARNCPLANDPWQVCRWRADASHARLEQEGSSRLPILKPDRFQAVLHAMPSIARHANASQGERAAAAILEKLGAASITARWSHPRHPVQALQLTVDDDEALLVFSRKSARLLRLPDLYDSMRRIASLSDIDGDGRLEVWYEETRESECEEDSEEDCRIHSHWFLGGEQFGGHLIPHLQGPPPTR